MPPAPTPDTRRPRPTRPRRRIHVALALLLGLLAAACAPRLIEPGPPVVPPRLAGERFHAADGAELAFRSWLPVGPPRAEVLAVHGFNDYGGFVRRGAAFLNAQSVAVYAYDQRGFGASPPRGRWPGVAALVRDLEDVAAAVKARHPGVPFFVLGESMGAGVAMLAATKPAPLEADGLILSAPAVWGRGLMPVYQRAALWLAAHTVPWLRVTGQGLGIQASDNLEMLRELGRDPLVIKETRIDAIWGLADLMDAALAVAPDLRARALILIGAKDEIITDKATDAMLRQLPHVGAITQPAEVARRTSAPGSAARAAGARSPGAWATGELADPLTIARYERGWHMLLRDRQAEAVWTDLWWWMRHPDAPLPSGADARGAAHLARLATAAE